MNFVPVLHGLRGLAAMAVLLYHWQGSFRGLNPLAQVTWLGQQWDLLLPLRFGWIGVDWFFVLSGFLLAGNLWMSALTLPEVRRFWARRFVRIYPAVWLQLALLLTLLWATGWLKNFNAAQALGNAALWLFPMPGGTQPYNGVYWTLPLELSFYLALPALLWALRRMGVAAFLALALAITLAWRLGIAGLHHGHSPHAVSLMFIRNVLPGMLFLFALGMALNGLRPWLAGLGRPTLWLLLLMGVQLGLLLTMQSRKGTAMQDDGLLLLADVLLAPCIAATIGLLLQPPPLFRWLASAPLVWLGEVSYGIYLWHFPIQRMLPKFFPWSWWGTPEGSLAALLVCLVLTLPLALASYRWIEQPALRWVAHKTRRVSP